MKYISSLLILFFMTPAIAGEASLEFIEFATCQFKYSDPGKEEAQIKLLFDYLSDNLEETGKEIDGLAVFEHYLGRVSDGKVREGMVAETISIKTLESEKVKLEVTFNDDFFIDLRASKILVLEKGSPATLDSDSGVLTCSLSF